MKVFITMVITSLLLLGCGESKSHEVHSDSKPLEKMKHLVIDDRYISILCLGGYQVYKLRGGVESSWLWVPNKQNSKVKTRCNQRTLADGSKP